MLIVKFNVSSETQITTPKEEKAGADDTTTSLANDPNIIVEPVFSFLPSNSFSLSECRQMNQKTQREMQQRDAGGSRKPNSNVQMPPPISRFNATQSPKSTRRKNNLLKELQSLNPKSKNLQQLDLPTGLDPTELFMTRHKAKELQAIARDMSGSRQIKTEPIMLENKKVRPTRKTDKSYTAQSESDDERENNNNDVEYDVEEKDDTDDDVNMGLGRDEINCDNARTDRACRSYDTENPRRSSIAQPDSMAKPEEQTKEMRLNLKRANGLAAWGRWRERKGM